MKTYLLSPDSAAGLSRFENETPKILRRSPFLYAAALRLHRENLRLPRETEAEEIGTRIHFRRSIVSEL